MDYKDTDDKLYDTVLVAKTKKFPNSFLFFGGPQYVGMINAKTKFEKGGLRTVQRSTTELCSHITEKNTFVLLTLSKYIS